MQTTVLETANIAANYIFPGGTEIYGHSWCTLVTMVTHEDMEISCPSVEYHVQVSPYFVLSNLKAKNVFLFIFY